MNSRHQSRRETCQSRFSSPSLTRLIQTCLSLASNGSSCLFDLAHHFAVVHISQNGKTTGNSLLSCAFQDTEMKLDDWPLWRILRLDRTSCMSISWMKKVSKSYSISMRNLRYVFGKKINSMTSFRWPTHQLFFLFWCRRRWRRTKEEDGLSKCTSSSIGSRPIWKIWKELWVVSSAKFVRLFLLLGRWPANPSSSRWQSLLAVTSISIVRHQLATSS